MTFLLFSKFHGFGTGGSLSELSELLEAIKLNDFILQKGTLAQREMRTSLWLHSKEEPVSDLDPNPCSPVGTLSA